jgi:uncharacterized protein YkwD
MPGWLWDLDMGQRRVLAAVAALVLALGLLVGGVALLGDDDGDEAVETGSSSTTSTTDPSFLVGSTSSTAPSTSTSSTVSRSTSTTKGAARATSTTRRSGGGGTGTTKPPTATTKPTTTTPPTQPPAGGPCATGGGAGGQMAGLYCAHRANLGLPSTTRNAALDAMAQEWAQKMANDGELSHRPNAEARQMVADRCDCPGWAENVAYDETVQEAWQAWLASTAGHRGHIEDPRDGEYGIGVASAGGYLWFVQVFGYYG